MDLNGHSLEGGSQRDTGLEHVLSDVKGAFSGGAPGSRRLGSVPHVARKAREWGHAQYRLLQGHTRRKMQSREPTQLLPVGPQAPTVPL